MNKDNQKKKTISIIKIIAGEKNKVLKIRNEILNTEPSEQAKQHSVSSYDEYDKIINQQIRSLL